MLMAVIFVRCDPDPVDTRPEGIMEYVDTPNRLNLLIIFGLFDVLILIPWYRDRNSKTQESL